MGSPVEEEIAIPLDPKVAGVRQVSGLYLPASLPTALLVLAHGAGAGMRHRFMNAVSRGLAQGGISTLRYQFPYMDSGRRYPDRPPKLLHTVRRAVAYARELRGDLPLFAGGKSMGGRMTSTAQSELPLPYVQGVVFFGFPLHTPKKPNTQRSDHLHKIRIPMLFLQGTRDKLADLNLLTPICTKLGAGAHLHRIEGADHGFDVLKRHKRSQQDALDELLDATLQFIEDISLRP